MPDEMREVPSAYLNAPPALDFLEVIRPKEEEFRRRHREDVGLVAAAAAVNFSCGYLYWLQRTINASINTPVAWDKVAALYLLSRALDDLRAVLEAGERGAPAQGFSLLSSVYEVEAALLEIGQDPSKGKRWVAEEGETGEVFSEGRDRNGKPIKKTLKHMGNAFYSSLGIAGTTPSALQEAHERRYGEVYKELCGYKHVQPSLQRQYGTVRTLQGLEVQPGPQWTPHMRTSVLAVYEVAENLAEHIFLAAAKAHLEPEQETHAVRFIKQMRAAWRAVELMAMKPQSGEEEA